MLLGYAMPHDAGLFEGISAYDQVQGLDAELAGQLAGFIDRLVAYREVLAQPHSVTEWTAQLTTLLDDFLQVELEGELVLIMDEGETTVCAGDIVIQRGTNHGWANRSDANCRIAFILIDGEFAEGLA